MRESVTVPLHVRITNTLCAISAALLVAVMLYEDLSGRFFSTPVADDAAEIQVTLEDGLVPLAKPDLAQGFDIAQIDRNNLLSTFQVDHTWGGQNRIVGDTIWDSDNVGFQDGIMILNLDRGDQQSPDFWHGSQVRALSKTGYGLYEVEMKPYVRTPGVVTAFFLYSYSTLDEIDMEFNSQYPQRVELNYFIKGVDFGKVEGKPVTIDLGFDAFADFHTYGFYYGSDIIIWYVDGREIYRIDYSHTSERVDSELYATVSIWAGGDEYIEWLGQTVSPPDGLDMSAYVRAVRYEPADGY